jgi:hypothetical protein
MSICHSSFLHTHKRPKIVVCLNKGNETNKKDVVKLLDRHPLFHTIYILKYLSKDFLEIRGRPAAYGVSVKNVGRCIATKIAKRGAISSSIACSATQLEIMLISTPWDGSWTSVYNFQGGGFS